MVSQADMRWTLLNDVEKTISQTHTPCPLASSEHHSYIIQTTASTTAFLRVQNQGVQYNKQGAPRWSKETTMQIVLTYTEQLCREVRSNSIDPEL